MSPVASVSSISGRNSSSERRTLIVAGVAHALHDGYTDMIYVLLPSWRTEFALGYSALALLRGLYAGVMAGLQVSAGSVTDRFGARNVLVFGTALAAFGYLLAGLTGTLIGLCIALAVAGAGSSMQHPVGSAAVSRAYGSRARGPLGIYNFCGDVGKAALPMLVSLLLTVLRWPSVLRTMAMLGVAVAVVIRLFMPGVNREREKGKDRKIERHGTKRGGFPMLFAIGALDSAARMGLLLFLPFLLKSKGATLPTIGFALSLVFMGGAAGKFACGWIGARVGVLWTVLVTEGGTAVAILLLIVLPLLPTLILLPMLGIMLNGTSSVLYGTIPELTNSDRAERAFALFYTGTIGSGAIAPMLFGMLGDAVGISWASAGTALTALGTIPLAIALAPRLLSE